MDKKKTTWKETWEKNYRGFRILWDKSPDYFIAMSLESIVTALTPYLTIWLSARIVTELAGLRRPEVLWPMVAVTVGAIALTTLLCGALLRWETATFYRMRTHLNRVYTDKTLSMDFVDVEKSENRDIFSQIQQNERWSSFGLPMIAYSLQYMVAGIAGVLGAVALTVSLFTRKVPEAAGGWVVLNNPLFILAVLTVLLLTSAMGPFCQSRGQSYWASTAEESRFGNRIFGAFGFLSRDNTKALDRRVYGQQTLAAHYLKKDNTFSATGPQAKKARGPMGLWAAASRASDVILTACIYVFVCLKAWAGAFGVGAVTQYVGAVTALTGSLSKLFWGMGMLKNNVPFMDTVFQYLDIPNSMYQGSLTTEKRNDRKYDVEFRDVSFKYPGNENWALRHVSIKFRVGSRLAVVGENGSGKTTFIKLLCRLYDPQEGQILLNGIDIRKYRYDDYMDIFSVVFQDFQLLSQSLGANVAGRRDYDRVKAEQALRDAGFDDRMESMPNGLDTQLYKEFDEKGVEVSGGEAQKIAIARALYKDAPFIILDEPTAALDPIAEAEIYSRFNGIVTDKTSIYISHRLSSCRFCDEIAVFDHGSIVQMGRHDTLVEADGKYRDLWNAQAQYYTQKEAGR